MRTYKMSEYDKFSMFFKITKLSSNPIGTPPGLWELVQATISSMPTEPMNMVCEGLTFCEANKVVFGDNLVHNWERVRVRGKILN